MRTQMVARIQAWFVLPMADALFSVSSLGRFRHRSPQESVVFTSQQTGWKRMIAKSGDGHTSTSGSSFTVCNPQQTLSASGLSIVPTAQCAMCKMYSWQ